MSYKHPDYSVEKVASRYIAYRRGELWLFEVNREGYTLRESVTDPQLYAQRDIDEALKLRGQFFNQVRVR